MPIFWFMLKLLVLLYATVWVRASLPRLRYDQLMDLGWKVLIEAAFLWAMVTGLIVVGRNEHWNLWIVTPAAADRRAPRVRPPDALRPQAASRRSKEIK